MVHSSLVIKNNQPTRLSGIRLLPCISVGTILPTEDSAKNVFSKIVGRTVVLEHFEGRSGRLTESELEAAIPDHAEVF